MGSRRLDLTTADAMFHVQSNSRLRPRAIRRVKESPLQNSQIPAESDHHRSFQSLFARQCSDLKFWTSEDTHSAAGTFDLQENTGNICFQSGDLSAP
jgi:hypothetical protein